MWIILSILAFWLSAAIRETSPIIILILFLIIMFGREYLHI